MQHRLGASCSLLSHRRKPVGTSQRRNVFAPFTATLLALGGCVGRDGYRRFRVVYVESGKGSGKSPLAAGVGLTGLIADNEARAEIYAAAQRF